MSISRATFGRLLEEARRKVVFALFGSKMLVFEGGQSSWPRCVRSAVCACGPGPRAGPCESCGWIEKKRNRRALGERSRILVADSTLWRYHESGRCSVTQWLESKRRAIGEACRRNGVARLYVFGSAIRDDFRPGESDVDLLVEFAPMESYARVDAYFALLEELRALLGQEIDLVMVGAVKNRYIARDIERTRQMLYAA
jgi:hypothetical protein